MILVDTSAIPEVVPGVNGEVQLAAGHRHNMMFTSNGKVAGVGQQRFRPGRSQAAQLTQPIEIE